MASGYSGTPLVKKLGIKSNFRILTINHPENYLELLQELPEGVIFVKDGSEIEFIHFFTKELDELVQVFPKLKGRLKKDGMIWVSWPKKASKVPTTVDEALVRKTGLEVGLVDIKICAVDNIWSGLKFVYRTKDR